MCVECVSCVFTVFSVCSVCLFLFSVYSVKLLLWLHVVIIWCFVAPVVLLRVYTNL